MKNIVDIAMNNKKNLESLHDGVDFARRETKRILHEIKGKELTRKWITVFLLFAFYTITTLFLTKDFLVLITGFSIIFGIVYYSYKPFLEKFKLKSYKQLVHDLAPLFEQPIHQISIQMQLIKEEQVNFEEIFIIDTVSEERIDLAQDITHTDLTERQIYTHVVNVISTNQEDPSLAAAKLCVSKTSDLPYHLL